MVERRNPVFVGEAVKKVMEHQKIGEVELIPIEDCDDRFLGEPIIATHDVPPFDRAPYDGFAIRAEDSKGATLKNPITFEVIEKIGAGEIASKEVKAFQAIRIMTGALMPKECDAVVMFEVTKESVKDGKQYMTIKREHRKGENVSVQGSETKKNDILIQRGRKINPGITALLATFGYDRVPVIKTPVVGLYVTGTELLDVNEPLAEGKIRNSNSYMIRSQMKRTGAQCDFFGKLIDNLDLCLEAMKASLDKCDILITTGGVSVGDFDHLPEIYKRLGATVLFNKVAMRPGSVTTVAVVGDKLLFGLSGNPSACYVGFELFVRPIIRAWLGSNKPHLKKVRAILKDDFPKPNPFTRFVRSKINFEETNVAVQLSGMDKSNVVTSLVDANALMILPGGTRSFEKGMEVDVLLLEDTEGSEWPWE